VNVKNREKTTPLAAASEGHVDTLVVLLGAGAKVGPGDLALVAIGDVADLARRLEAIRTTLSGPGLPEHPDIEDTTESLRRRPGIHFYWE